MKWSNWAGNQDVVVDEVFTPRSEDELIARAQRAVADGDPIAQAGSGHSFSRLVDSRRVIFDMTGLSGLVDADADACTATVLAGTTIADLGPLLWEHGLALRNMGDIDRQTIGGAVSTATHGSGIKLGSLASTVRGLRLVTGTGDVVDVDGSSPDLLHAAQVAVGTLGTITRLTLDVTPAYRLQEVVEVVPVEALLENWASGVPTERHYQFFYAPTETSHALYELPYFPKDHCWVKVLREVPVDPETEPITGIHGSRSGRSYLIYPDTADEVATWVELEYMVDADDARDAFVALRDMMRSEHPHAISPIQLRWIRGEEAFLSPMHRRDSVSISVSGELTEDWHGFLHAVDQCLAPWGPRPHWGKQYFLDGPRTRAIYPALDRFLDVREQLDPNRLYLNAHLADVFGI